MGNPVDANVYIHVYILVRTWSSPSYSGRWSGNKFLKWHVFHTREVTQLSNQFLIFSWFAIRSWARPYRSRYCEWIIRKVGDRQTQGTKQGSKAQQSHSTHYKSLSQAASPSTPQIRLGWFSRRHFCQWPQRLRQRAELSLRQRLIWRVPLSLRSPTCQHRTNIIPARNSRKKKREGMVTIRQKATWNGRWRLLKYSIQTRSTTRDSLDKSAIAHLIERMVHGSRAV